MIKVAFIGGGPGGLMAAYLLEQKCDAPCDITVFEASPRVGGKILTKKFRSADVLYEAGVAELYGYSMTGPDPLRELIEEKLGLQTVPMDGATVTLGDKILRNSAEIKKLCSKSTWENIRNFRQVCKKMLSPEEYYEGHWQDDNDHEWADVTCQEVLDKYVPDATARKYLKVAAHSDLATEPHLTNGLNGLKNFLMDIDGYIYLYSIVGGNEQLVNKLRDHLEASPVAHLNVNSPVIRVEKTPANKYLVTVKRDREISTEEFDFVAVALPNNWVNTIDYGDEVLRQAMLRHHAYYDKPAHYLRVTILFKERFWADTIKDSWFMSDAFGGCCVYDETARHEGNGYGALGWLIAGTDALTMANFKNEELIQKALESLPAELQKGRELFVEGRIHRWLYSVSGQPGGLPQQEPKKRHIPAPKTHPGFYLIGDYLFDSTLNGVLDSADFVTDMMLDLMMKQWYVETVGQPKEKLDRQFYENYRGLGHYVDNYQKFFDAKFINKAIRLAWKEDKPYKILVLGAGNGAPLEALATEGVNAWGLESNAYIHSLTPKKWLAKNQLGDPRKLPFKDNQFDYIFDTSVAYYSEKDAIKIIKELYRVAKKGVIFGAVSTDVNPAIITKYRLFDGVKTLNTLWEWSELFMANGFDLEINSDKLLKKLWSLETASRGADGSWYIDIESIRYTYFSKLDEDDEDNE